MFAVFAICGDLCMFVGTSVCLWGPLSVCGVLCVFACLVFVGTSECLWGPLSVCGVLCVFACLVFVVSSVCLVFVGTSESLGEFSGKQDVGQFALSVALQRAVRLSAEEQVVKVDTT